MFCTGIFRIGSRDILACANSGRRTMTRTMALASNATKSDDYCVELVKKHDFDSYLSGLLVPREARAAYFAVRAFNVEIAMIKDQTHGNAMAGRIRFQWWRDVLDEIYKGGSGGSPSLVNSTPVAHALAIHIHRHNLTARWFERSLDARQRDLSGEPPGTLDDLENYAEQGHSSIIYLVLEALGIQDESSEFAASHVGVSSGLVTILRAFPFHASQQQVYLPQDLMRKHAVPPQSVLRGPSTETELKALRDCVFDVASQAYGHLDKARALDYSPLAVHALMPAVRSAMFLETLRQVDFNPRHENLHKQTSQMKYQMNLLHARWTKKI